MPKSTFIEPDWASFADAAIENLHRHHGGLTSYIEETKEPVSDPDAPFDGFDGDAPQGLSTEVSSHPVHHIPARQLLTVIRLAASFGGTQVLEDSRQSNALSVISDIAPSDLHDVKDTLKLAFPQAGWSIAAPNIADGKIGDNVQSRFETAIAERIDNIKPVLVLQAHGIVLPRYIAATAPRTLPLAPLSRDILMVYLRAGQLCDQIPDAPALHSALPENTALAELGMPDICVALRASSLHQALQQLTAMISAAAQASGPRLQDFSGDSPALTAARRIVDDLVLWKQGNVRWQDINHSMLLHGPPGTGKTWLARAMGNAAGLAVLDASFASWQATGHLGNMLAAMRTSFSEARRKAPCLLIIDEIDAVGARNDGDPHASNYRTQVINGFLGEMDEIAQQEGLVVIGTCNHIERIDPAVIRAGRMDLKILVPPPDAEAILGILRHGLHNDITEAELRILSHQAVGQSAAEIDAAIRAARSDARHARTPLDLSQLQARMGIRTSGADDRILWRIAVHEAGHAIAGTALGLGTIESIAITNHGGLITRRNAPNENLLSDIEAEITYALAGRAAEQLVLGEVSAGAGGVAISDLALATNYARRIETTFGLGFEGLVWHANPDALHLQTPAIRDRVRQRLTRAEQRAGRILQQNREVLEKLAKALMQNRSMRVPEIKGHLSKVTALAPIPPGRQPPESVQPSPN